jgi:DNA invertase Pin-like site-specific DNA recombinase
LKKLMNDQSQIIRSVIGYVRVSTKRQAVEGDSLAAQREAILRYAKKRGMQVNQIFGDETSAMGPDVLERNGDLKAAIEEAKKLGVPLLVNDVSRITRNTGAMPPFLNREVKVISIREGGLLSPERFKEFAARAQQEGERIGRRTTEAIAGKKARGAKLGNRTNLPDAQRRGVIETIDKANRLAEHIVLLLEDDPDIRAREIVDILNREGLKTGKGNSWTLGRVRRPIRRAMGLLEDGAKFIDDDE